MEGIKTSVWFDRALMQWRGALGGAELGWNVDVSVSPEPERSSERQRRRYIGPDLMHTQTHADDEATHDGWYVTHSIYYCVNKGNARGIRSSASTYGISALDDD